MASRKILKYVFFDIVRSRLVITYTLLLLALSLGIIYMGRDAGKASVSLLNIVILIVPLVCIIFGTIHYYNSRKFIEMLLTLPVKRSSIFWAEYFGLSLSLSLGFAVGAGIPLLSLGVTLTSIYQIGAGVMLSFIFTSLAFFSSVINRDKARGIGVSLMIWFYLAILFDGMALLIYTVFNDYPLEKLTIILSSLNPIDLARIAILLRLDISALLGYTGATFQNFFGSIIGSVFSSAFLLLWAAVPTIISLKIFNKKNF